MVLLALACAAVLIATAPLALAIQEPTRARQAIYGICLIASSALLVIAVLALLGIARTPSTAILPLGIALAGRAFPRRFTLRVSPYGGFGRSRSRRACQRFATTAFTMRQHVGFFRFYPSFLARGVQIILLTNDAFHIPSLSSETISLSSLPRTRHGAS